MDARQGVNTEEQVSLLKMVTKNLASKKDMPTIILFNKVDEPDDSQQAMLVQEARHKIEELFSVACREKSLEAALAATKGKSGLPSDAFPVFLATSAIHAFFYRTASLLSFEAFKKKFDSELIDMIGREEVGRFRWKKLSPDEKFEAVYESVRADSNYRERLEATNFDKFLSILSLAVGGSDVQAALLEKQLAIAIESLMGNEDISVSMLRSIHDKSLVLGKDLNHIKKSFWSIYKDCRGKAMKVFVDEVDVKALSKTAKLLWTYSSFARALGWSDEEDTIRNEVCKLVRDQLGVILNKHNIENVVEDLSKDTNGDLVDLCYNCNKNRKNSVFGTKKNKKSRNVIGRNEGAPTWESLSLLDWLSILESVLVMGCNQTFCDHFSRDKIFLSHLKSKFLLINIPTECKCSSCTANRYDLCSNCRSSHPICRKGNWKPPLADLTPKDLSSTNPMLKIQIPECLSDEEHWGHVAWKCCKLLQTMDKKSN